MCKIARPPVPEVWSLRPILPPSTAPLFVNHNFDIIAIDIFYWRSYFPHHDTPTTYYELITIRFHRLIQFIYSGYLILIRLMGYAGSNCVLAGTSTRDKAQFRNDPYFDTLDDGFLSDT